MLDSEPLYNGNKPTSNSSSRFPTDAGGTNRGGDHYTIGGADQEQGSYNQQKIIAGLLRFKWLILLTVLAGGAAAWYYTQNLIPQYRASGTVIINIDQDVPYRTSGDLASMVNRSLVPHGSGTRDNHIQTLQSRSFAERLADEVMARDTMSNGETFPILLHAEEGNEPVRATHSQVVSRIRGNTEVKRSSGSNDLIEVIHHSADPFEATELANLFMDEFVALIDERARSSIRASLEYLQKVILDDVGQRLANSELRIEAFMRTEPGGIDLSSHTSRLVSEVAVLEQQIEINELELESMRQRYVILEEELNEIEPGLADQMKLATTSRVRIMQENMANLTIERLMMFNRNPELRANEELEPRLQQINREMAELNEEIDELVTYGLEQTRGFLFTEPGEINTRILELKRGIAEQEVEMLRLEAITNLARRQVAEYEAQLQLLPQNQMNMARLERNRQRNESMYNELSSRAFELELLEQSTEGNVRIFETALQPGSPYSPNEQKNLVFGLLFGFGLSVTGVLLLVMLDHRIDSIDLLKKLQLPVLSVIPEKKSIIKKQFKRQTHFRVEDKNLSTSLISLHDPISNVSESYRRLYNNLRYNNPDSRNKVFVLTSPGKGEGKTTAVANLAVTMGETGKRVLLMDCDFRKPNMHNMFGVKKEPGITNYLFNGNPLGELITPSPAPGLDLLTAGTQTVSPDRAINSKKMEQLIGELSEMYDYILIDTAPFGIISDSAPLIRMADGVIALVRFKKTKTPELEQLLENLYSIHAEIMGTVLNDFDPKVASGYYANNRRYNYNTKVYRSYNEKVSRTKTDKKLEEKV